MKTLEDAENMSNEKETPQLVKVLLKEHQAMQMILDQRPIKVNTMYTFTAFDEFG